VNFLNLITTSFLLLAGWMEEYNPVFAKWTGSGEHFGFVNQPSAAYANYAVLVESVTPVIVVGQGINNDEDAIKKLTRSFLEEAQVVFENEIDQVFRTKLGFLPDQDVGDGIWSHLEPLLRKSRTDWTLFWRQLTYVMRDFSDLSSTDYSGMLSQLESTEEEKERKGASPFYEPLSDELRKDWLAFIEQWRTALSASSPSDECGLAIYERMRTTNPKFVLREWMLVDAYNGAANDEEAELFYLFDLIKRPYDEGSDTEIRKYYQRASDEVLLSGGTAFMS
jgi:serine/tyrosine/threonine adenylyltransferase